MTSHLTPELHARIYSVDFDRTPLTQDTIASTKALDVARGRFCQLPKCERIWHQGGLCHAHYDRWWNATQSDKAKKRKRVFGGTGSCSLCGCNCRGKPRRIPQARPINITLEDTRFFFGHISPQPNGCWLWLSEIDPQSGYGRMTADGRRTSPHRWSWVFRNGQVPEGMHVDHVCHSQDLSCWGGDNCPHRACVNPEHLEPVTPDENQRRKQTSKRRSSSLTVVPPLVGQEAAY